MAQGDRHPYRDELVDAQRGLSQRLREADTPADLTILAGDLARTLRSVADNEALWADLEGDEYEGLAQEQLFQLALVDWEQFLRDRGVEEASELAGELIFAATRAQQGRGNWGEVRQALVSLAERLRDDAQQVEAGRPGRLRVLRERVASGVSVLKHLKDAALLKGAGQGAAEALVPGIAVAVIAHVAFPPAILVTGLAAAVVGLAGAAGEAANRGLGEIEQQRVDDRLRCLAVEFSGIREGLPGRKAEFEDLGRLDPPAGWESPPEVIDVFSRLRSWAAEIGAKIAAEWPFVVAHLGGPGAAVLDEITRGVAAIRAAVRDLSNALFEHSVEGSRRATDAAAVAINEVGGYLHDLGLLLAMGAFRQ
jgi:hypothetical protein